MTTRVVPTAYGRDALEALRQVVSDAKRGDAMAPVTILVPNSIAGVVARRHLAEHGVGDRGPGIAGVFVTTLPRLAEQLAAASLHPRRPATAAVTAAAWRAALAEDPGCFDRVREHPATIRALTSAHRELRDVSSAGLDSIRNVTALTPDLARLHQEVVVRLSASTYDATDLLNAATGKVAEAPDSCAELGTLVLYLPQALTQAEARFAGALAARGITAIAGLTGVRRADAPVRRTLTDLGFPAPEENPKPRLATRVLHASDADDEARCVVREVTRALADGTPAHRVAILYGAAQPYARLLHEHLAATGLAVNGPGTRAVHERALARGFLGVLELADADLPRAATFSALAEAPAGDLNGDTVKVARWERVSRMARVLGGDDWATKLDGYVGRQRDVIAAETASGDPSQGRVAAAERDIEAATALQRFVTRLQTRLAEGSRLSTWEDLSTWALDLFHDLYGKPGNLGRLPVEEQYAAAVIESSLRGLASLGSFETAADLTGLIEVVSLDLEAALPRVGRFGEGVFVGPISAAIGLELDLLFTVGLAEDSYPGRLHEDALLNDDVRAATQQLRQPRDRLDAKHRALLAAFSSAPVIVASFPRGDLRRSTERLPSRFLLHTLRDITGNTELAATAWDQHPAIDPRRLVGSRSFADELRSTPMPASEQEWRVRALSSDVDIDDSTIDAARVLSQARASHAFTRFDGNLGHVADLPDYAHSDRVISPTSLEAFATCPHRYFVQKLLRVEPLEQPEEIITISAAEIGNLIHRAMDRLITECQTAGVLPSYGEPWTAEQRARLKEIALEEGAEFVARGATGHPRLWQRELQQILVDLDRMLDDDNAWRAGRDAAVVASELTFGFRDPDSDPPVIIELEDGRVHMLGSADKVDRTRDGVLLVTDIKSGKARKFEGLEEDPVVAGSKLQLPVYAYAARAHFGQDRAEAQYWFVRGRDAFRRIQVVLDDDVEKVYAETLATLVSSIKQGLFIPKPSEKPAYGWTDCEYCTPGGLGHEEARSRYERKRTAPTLEPLISLVDPDGLADDNAEEPAGIRAGDDV